MTEHRLPLQSLNGNVIASPTPAASSSRSVVKKAIKLAPIFTRSYSTPSSSQLRSENASSSTQAQTPSSPTRNSSRKRQRRLGPVARVLPDSPSASSREDVKMSGSEDEEDEEIAEADDRRRLKHGRVVSMHDYFPTTPSSRPDGHHLDGKNHWIRKSVIAIPEVKVDTGLWRRKRGRMGIPARGSMMMSGPTQITTPTTPYLERLVTSLSHRPTEPPSLILIPSLHPWQQPRDFAPPLTVAFSNSAKRYSSRDAKEAGMRRFVAVAAEEGGVRVVDVDEPVGENRDVGGWFWRAHGNAVLDLKWSRNDTHILTASGDQTARLHVMDGETPRLLSTLSSHSASLKSCTFLDTSRSSVPFENAVATAGRDGNILIFDVRGPDKMITDDHTLTVDAVPTQGRTRGGYSAGVPGFEPQFSDGTNFWKFRMANAHGDSPRKKNQIRSVTSLVALQSMPGYLASAGSADGIVKLWDPRFQQKTQPQAVASLPDPTAVNGARPRGIHAMCEQPSTGDLHILTGDSKIHVVRPSLNVAGDNSDLIQPVRYVHPELRSNFWMGISFSPCGRYLASGSTKGGVMTWDTASRPRSVRGSVNEVVATRLSLGESCDGREREVNAVDWGYDMLAACADDFATRIWREDAEAARSLKSDPAKAGQDWAGVVV